MWGKLIRKEMSANDCCENIYLPLIHAAHQIQLF